MPVSKVDSRCFNLSQKINQFLSLENANRFDLTPPEFWKEIVQSEEAVSSYIVCLIAKLISLDSDQGLKPLPHVYKDLVEMPVDHSKYKQWSAKPLPTNCKSTALELQYGIITTIRHLKDCYGYAPNIHLRHMYLRWNLARNFCAEGGRKADEFEEKVISPFSVAQAKEVIHSPVNSPTHKSSSMSPPPSSFLFTTSLDDSAPLSPEEEEELALVIRLTDECYTNHRRAFFGALPPEQCKLCSYTNATDALSYVRLRDLTSRSPRLLRAAMSHVLDVLTREVSHAQSYGEREVLLPLLHLFREFLTMMCPVNTVEVYKSLMPFYMWPVSHSEYTKGVLDQVMQEGRVRGTTFRRRVLTEQDVGLTPAETKVKGHFVHMLVDTSHPLTRGALLHDIMTHHQEKPDQRAMQRLIIRNVFKSVDMDVDMVELEGKLLHLSAESLKSYCLRALEIVGKVKSSAVDATPILRSEVDKFHKDLLQHVESDEQRDSAVSCSSADSETQLTRDKLGSFPLPLNHISAHSLNDTQYPTILNKLREILIICRQKILATPIGDAGGRREGVLTQSMEEARRPPVDIILTKKSLASVSSSSQTSLDSTGSSNIVEPDKQDTRVDPGVSIDVIASDTDSRTSVNGVIIPNGKAGGGSGNHVTTKGNHMTNGGDHVSTNGDHVTSPPAVDTGDENGQNDGNAPHKRPTSLHGLNDVELNSNNNHRNINSASTAGTDTPKSCDRLSMTSEDRISDSGSNRDFSPASLRRSNVISGSTTAESPRTALVRRQTCPSGMYAAKRSSTLGSGTGHSPSNPRRYTKSAQGVRTSTIQSRVSVTNHPGANKVKIRRNPSAATRSMKKRISSHGSRQTSSTSSSRLLKILLAGNDSLVSHTAKAYAHLQVEEPNLLSGLEIKFYHIPLSRASLIHTQYPEIAASSVSLGGGGGGGAKGGEGQSSDLPEPMFEQIDLSGNDVHIGRFLAHMDSWYERNVMMAVHHLLRLIPRFALHHTHPPIPGVAPRPMSPLTAPPVSLGEVTLASRTNLTPSRVLLEAVSNYTREARNCININLYRLKMNIKNEKSHKIDYREVYMLHRLDIQRLSGKKAANRQVKTFEANVTMTQLALDGGLVRSEVMEMRDIWAIRASNVPRAGDPSVPNPESDCFEMNIIKAISEGGRFGGTKFRAGEESQYHVNDLVIETREKPFTVMVDCDTDVLLENVIRLEVQPAYVEQSSAHSYILSVPTHGNTRLNEHTSEKKLQFPLMTYWPVDL